MASEVRSGSTYIAESISYFFDKQYGVDVYNLANELFTSLTDLSQSPDIVNLTTKLYQDQYGWRASKIMRASLSIIVREARKSAEIRELFFGKNVLWIVVRRKNKVKQAVSLAIARATGNYHNYDSSVDLAVNFRDSAHAMAEIQSALEAIILSDIYLETFKEKLHKTRFVEIYYEDFIKNEKHYMRKVCRLCGHSFLEDELAYRNLSKLIPTLKDLKDDLEARFKSWLLENGHSVAG